MFEWYCLIKVNMVQNDKILALTKTVSKLEAENGALLEEQKQSEMWMKALVMEVKKLRLKVMDVTRYET